MYFSKSQTTVLNESWNVCFKQEREHQIKGVVTMSFFLLIANWVEQIKKLKPGAFYEQ